MDRRELLKFFGIGTVISPVGQSVTAELLSVPELTPVLVDKFPDGHDPNHWKDRLEWNPYEAIWLKFWQIENSPSFSVNYGIGPLEGVLQRKPTAQEKAAVAGVLQWFGTNCGHCFIQDTLKACGYLVKYDGDLPNIEKLNALRRSKVWNKQEIDGVAIQRRGRTILLK